MSHSGPGTLRITRELTALLQQRITRHGIGPDQLLFANHAGQPISRSTFRARVWLPAVKATELDYPLRWHDLRHTHASWLLAGGADLKTVMDRLGHTQISTTQQYLHSRGRFRPPRPPMQGQAQTPHLAVVTGPRRPGVRPIAAAVARLREGTQWSVRSGWAAARARAANFLWADSAHKSQ